MGRGQADIDQDHHRMRGYMIHRMLPAPGQK
jgi:hypothetical protein